MLLRGRRGQREGKALRRGTHFLGLFDGQGHANCGSSDDWADEAKFTAEAMRIIEENFGGQP